MKIFLEFTDKVKCGRFKRNRESRGGQSVYLAFISSFRLLSERTYVYMYTHLPICLSTDHGRIASMSFYSG